MFANRHAGERAALPAVGSGRPPRFRPQACSLLMGPGTSMSITLQHEDGNTYRLELCGTLQAADFERCQGELVREMGRVGRVRLLILLREFEGWDPDGRWNDLGFYTRHGDSIDRIAIVGPERWRGETLMFAGADLRAGPVEFFETAALTTARAWLAS
jgi:hypothetical protein